MERRKGLVGRPGGPNSRTVCLGYPHFPHTPIYSCVLADDSLRPMLAMMKSMGSMAAMAEKPLEMITEEVKNAIEKHSLSSVGR